MVSKVAFVFDDDQDFRARRLLGQQEEELDTELFWPEGLAKTADLS